MFQQFLDSVQEKHLRKTLPFKSEIVLVKDIIKDKDFRTSFKVWLDKIKNIRNESPTTINRYKTENNILAKIKKCKNLLEKYHLCNQSLINVHPKLHNYKLIQSKIYYERANVLIKSENYYEALQSLLMITYTNELKVIYRKTLCALKLNNEHIFKNSLNQLKLLYTNYESHSEKMKEELNKYRQEYKKLLKKDVTQTNLAPSFTEKFLEKFKDISIRITPEKGRHIISGECIEETSKILTEKVFAFVSLHPCFTTTKDLYNFDCQNCAKTNIVPVLCQTCNHAVYCSLDCMIGHQNIHIYECSGHQLWLWHEIGIAYLAFRTFLEGFQQFQEILDQNFPGKDLESILKSSVEVDFSPEQNQYMLLLSLQTHFEEMMHGDLTTFALTACALTLYLKLETTFFEDKNLLEDEEKWEMFISSIILRHIGQMVCNAHTMSDMRFEYGGQSIPYFINISLLNLKREGLIIRNDETFAGIYPFISLLNHSCKPNIVNCFNGAQLTIKAKETIKNKDEILNSYGINFLRINKVERQAVLRDQYHFNCECAVCLQPEDTFDFLQKIRCFTCQNILDAEFDMESMEILQITEQKCKKCGSLFDTKKFYENIRQVSDNVEKILDRKTLKVVLQSLEYCSQCLHHYHEVIYFFSKTLINTVGLTFKSELIEIAKNMLNICKYLHGEHSVEYLLDRVFAANILLENESQIYDLAKNVLSTQSFLIFKNIYQIIVKK